MKSLLLKHYPTTLKLIVMGVLISLAFLNFRLKTTHTYYLLFLVWNLILAIVPLVIAVYGHHSTQKGIRNKSQFTSITMVCCITLWLLFLPNAPYLFTDLIHVQNSQGAFKLLDSCMIMVFAFTGFICALWSMDFITAMFTDYYSIKNQLIKHAMQHSMWWLCAVGIYLGRVLRFNSWDAFTKPQTLLTDCTDLLLHPIVNYKAWLFIGVMGTILSVSQILWNKYRPK